MIRKPIEHRRPRSQPDPTKVFDGGVFPCDVIYNNANLRLTFSENVTLAGLPMVTVDGVRCTAAVAVSATIIDLTYAGGVTPGQTWVILANDPSIRNFVGGRLEADTGLVEAPPVLVVRVEKAGDYELEFVFESDFVALSAADASKFEFSATGDPDTFTPGTGKFDGTHDHGIIILFSYDPVVGHFWRIAADPGLVFGFGQHAKVPQSGNVVLG